MSYTDIVKKANKEGKTKQLTHNILTWNSAGQMLIGKVQAILDFDKGKYDTIVKQYILDTDDGLISTILGAATDKQLENVDLIGAVICIEFEGQFKLDDGRPCNKFKIQLIENA